MGRGAGAAADAALEDELEALLFGALLWLAFRFVPRLGAAADLAAAAAEEEEEAAAAAEEEAKAMAKACHAAASASAPVAGGDSPPRARSPDARRSLSCERSAATGLCPEVAASSAAPYSTKKFGHYLLWMPT